MKKIYSAPEVTVTMWASEDIITTSGGVTADSGVLTIDTASEDIASVSYDLLDK